MFSINYFFIDKPNMIRRFYWDALYISCFIVSFYIFIGQFCHVLHSMDSFYYEVQIGHILFSLGKR